MTILGINGWVLVSIAMFMSIMANPNGKLLPGIDTGSKNGATRIKQDIKPPCSPISSKNSLKLTPSSGICSDTPEIILEVDSVVDSLDMLDSCMN